MKFLLYLTVIIFYFEFCACDIYSDLVQQEWNSFKVQYAKTYKGSIEESYRLKIFIANLKAIHRHNQRYSLGSETFQMGINEFTDMFDFEIAKTMCGINGSALSEQLENGINDDVFTFLPPENINIPDTIDWRTKGAVTEVKNQGRCGSCWAFSSTGSLEGQTFRLTGKLPDLSEQNLIDCSYSYGNHGCEGGRMDFAFQYVHKNNGIDTEQNYPYKGIDTFQCKYKKAYKGGNCKGYTMIQPVGAENKLQMAVATIGPISVAIEATDKFMSYSGGIFYDPNCSRSFNAINHAVLVIGYGKDSVTGLDYWLVKNSWGTNWGDHGFIKMIRNKNNNCNIATFAIYPLV